MKKLAALLVLACLVLGAAATSVPAHAQRAKWTFMVYLDADNNLEDVGIDNFLAMAKVGWTDDVKIVVQFDRTPGNDNRYGDWTTTKRFLVAKGMDPTSANALQDLGELNMADPATLSDFVIWAAAAFPADHYFLDLWDHGLGWQGVALDDSPITGDVMSAVELGSALSGIRDHLQGPLDILANDACRMTLEIMYEARQYVNYMVGSEKDEPVQGWPYDAVLGALVSNPSMTPTQLASTLVDDYVDSYLSASDYSVAMALVNSSALPPVVTALNNLASAVNFTLPYSARAAVDARNASEHYEGDQCVQPQAGDDYDLYDVATKLAARMDDPRVKEKAAGLQTAIDVAVLYERHKNLPTAVNCVKAINAHGLSLWYPWSMGSKQGAYEQLDFSRDSLWDEHILTYHNSTRSSVNFTSSVVVEDKDHDGVNDTAAVSFRSNASGTVYAELYMEGASVSTSVYQVSVGTSYQREIVMPSPGAYYLYLSLRLPLGTMNATSFGDLLADVPILVRGFVRGSSNEPLDGAQVTVRNTRTNQEINTTTVRGLYSFRIIYPIWLRIGDNISVEARLGGMVATTELTFAGSGQRLVWADLELETGARQTSFLGPYWPWALIPLVGLFLEAFLILSVMRRNRTRPGKHRRD